LVDMSRVIRKGLLVQLTTIEAVDEQLESRFQGFRTTGKITRAAFPASSASTE